MNDWNQLESRLSSWTPRRPSPALRKKLFPSAIEEETGFSEAHLWRFLAPGLALLLALCMISSRNTQSFTPFISSSTGLVATVALSHPHLAAYCVNSAYTEHNDWPTTSFELADDHRSRMTPIVAFYTNHLTP
jgi:hypothetical protein